MVTRRPRDFRRLPRLEAVRPFPREEATPPVTNTCLVGVAASRGSILPERVRLRPIPTHRTRRPSWSASRISASVAVTCPSAVLGPVDGRDVGGQRGRRAAPARSPDVARRRCHRPRPRRRPRRRARTAARPGRRRRCRRRARPARAAPAAALPSGLTASSAPARPAGCAAASRRPRRPRPWSWRRRARAAGPSASYVGAPVGDVAPSSWVISWLPSVSTSDFSLGSTSAGWTAYVAGDRAAGRLDLGGEPGHGLLVGAGQGQHRDRVARRGRRRTAGRRRAAAKVSPKRRDRRRSAVVVGRRRRRQRACGRPRRAGRRPARSPAASARKTATSETTWLRNEIT